MRRVAVSAIICCAALALFVTGCKQNQPPAKPKISGPTTGMPGKSLTYTFSTTDPEEQSIAFMVSWGDDTEEEWDEGYESSEEVRRSHKFADSGVYVVKVKARDSKEVESPWSDSILVAVAFWPPNPPLRPTGPASCTTGVAATFVTKATHPLGDSVWFQFDWGDTIADWAGPFASDSAYSAEHVFDTAGTYNVTARAKDARNGMSAWSETLAVTVTFVEAPARPDVTLEPIDKGAKLHLSWGKVANAESYQIKLDDSVRTVTDTTFDVTNPAATIEVRAVKGSRKSDAFVIQAGIVETANLVIYGLSAVDSTHLPAFGFDSTGQAIAYSTTGNQLRLDFYADDLTHLDTMFLVNAGKTWNTKGNGLKAAGTQVYGDAKLADTADYKFEHTLVVDEVYYLWLDRTNNGWSPDDNFAKAKVVQLAGPLVALQIGYQRVGGMRWLSK